MNRLTPVDTSSDQVINALSHRLGQQVRGLRKKIRLTRRALSQQTGISERYLADLESGKANVSLGLLDRVANALSTSIPAMLNDGHDIRIDYQPLNTLLRKLSPDEQKDAYQLLSKKLGGGERLKGIALIGMRGAGKSTLGQAAARAAGVPFVRLTRKVEQLAGMNTAELMELGGEKAYRRYELMALQKLARSSEKIVLETGGGLVGEEAAYNTLLEHFTVVWIKARPEEHMARVMDQGDMRPMAGHSEAMNDLKALLGGREAAHARADYVIDTSGRTPEPCVAELIALSEPVLR